MNILVAEDDEGFVRLMHEILGAMPEYQTTFAKNGMEAWWHLTNPSKKYDLCVFDITMPLVDGLTLLQRVRETREFADMPVIMSTGLTARQKIAEAGALRATNYLVKPFPPSALIEKIQAIEQSLGLAVKEVRIA